MKYTAKQMAFAHRKLARAIGKWNHPSHPNRSRAMCELFNAAWMVMEKAGVRSEYERGLKIIDSLTDPRSKPE